QTNVRWLRQALALVERLGDKEYAASPAGLSPHRAGAHLRHVLEFYECFLNGLDSGRIDYDARKRDESIENSRQAAAAKIEAIIRRLTAISARDADSIVTVRVEDGAADAWLLSSIGRELQVLRSHTIHHFALMAITLQAHGVPLDADFGVAPSTLRYRREAA